MIFKDVSAKEGIFCGSESLYSCDGDNIYSLNKDGTNIQKIDFISENLKDVKLKSSKDVLTFVKDNKIKAIYMPSKKILLEKTLKDEISSFCISPSGMNISLGFTNGKTIIYNNLLGDSLGKFTLFSDGSNVEHIEFLDDEIMLGVTKEKIILISLLKKGAVSKISSPIDITAVYPQKNDLIYTTSKNEIYFVNLKNLKNPEINLLATLSSHIVDVKLSEENAFISSLDTLYMVDLKSRKLKVIKDNYSAISNIYIDKHNSIYVGHKDFIEFIPNPLDIKSDEIIKEDSADNLDNDEIVEVKVDKTVRFLTVDDSTTIRLVIKKSILNNFKDVEVGEAIDGIEALKYLKAHPNTDVVFLDWNMPNMNGDVVVEEISKMPELKHLKIIMATTEGGKERVKQMISKGVIGYLVKPLKAGSVNPLAQKMIEMVQEERVKNV